MREAGEAVEPGCYDEGPGFAYTVGLHARFGHPELICFGLRSELMHAMLNDPGLYFR